MNRFLSFSTYYIVVNSISTVLFFLIYVFFKDNREEIIQIGYVLQFYYIISNGFVVNLFSKLDRYNPKEIIFFSIKLRFITLLLLSIIIFITFINYYTIEYFLLFFIIGLTYYESFPQYLNLKQTNFIKLTILKIISAIIAFLYYNYSNDIIFTYVLLICINHIVTLLYLIYLSKNYEIKSKIKMTIYPTLQGFTTYMYSSFLVLASKQSTPNWEIFGIVDKVYNAGINLISPTIFSSNTNLISKKPKYVFLVILTISLIIPSLLFLIEIISSMIAYEIIFTSRNYIYLTIITFLGLCIPQLVYYLNYLNKEKLVFYIVLFTGLVNIPLFFIDLALDFRLIINSTIVALLSVYLCLNKK